MASSAAVDTTYSAVTPFTVGPSIVTTSRLPTASTPISRVIFSSSLHLQCTFNSKPSAAAPVTPHPLRLLKSLLNFYHTIYFNMLLKHVLSEIV
jgi:hypothetical protein